MNAREFRDAHPDKFRHEYNEWCADGLGYDWWSCVYDIATEDGEKKGFDIEHIYFSGFYSQGDGACWTGRVDIPKYIRTCCVLDEPKYNVLLSLIEDGWSAATVYVCMSGGYSHENAMRFSDRVGFYGGLDPHDTVQEGVYKGAYVQELFEAIGGYSWLDEFEEELLCAARDFAVDIYSQLEEEYEHLTSEESYIEYCECNDVVFDVCDAEDATV